MFVIPFFTMLMTKEDNYQSFLEDSLMVITGKNEIQNKMKINSMAMKKELYNLYNTI